VALGSSEKPYHQVWIVSLAREKRKKIGPKVSEENPMGGDEGEMRIIATGLNLEWGKKEKKIGRDSTPSLAPRRFVVVLSWNIEMSCGVVRSRRLSRSPTYEINSGGQGPIGRCWKCGPIVGKRGGERGGVQGDQRKTTPPLQSRPDKIHVWPSDKKAHLRE